VTSQKDQIQALIADIDNVLQKTTPRLPWVVSGEVTQQRQILERVRNYLQQRQMAGEGFEQADARPDLLMHDIYYQPARSSYQSPQAGAEVERSLPYGQNEAAAQQMLQALIQEMGYLRSNVVQPLQSDVEGLRHQREALIQEIRQLESQRQGYAGTLPGNQQQVIAEFLQALMTRLQETLPQQVAQSLRSSNQQSLPQSASLALTGSAPAVATTSDAPYPGFGNIQVPQAQADELLIKLDSTLSVVFESLQRNVQAYEESLSQGLNKMHSLGQQGEMMFTALISHLASQLGQEASTYLQPSTPARLDSARVTPPLSGATAHATQTAQPSPTTAIPSFLEQPQTPTSPNSIDAARSVPLPFPGTELSSNVPADASAAPANIAEPVDTAIESWLRSAGSVEGESAVDLEIAALNLEGFDLNQLAAQDVNALLELDANLLGTNLPPQPMLPPEPAAPGQLNTTEPLSGTMSIEDTADIDAALKLLEQLSSELQEQPASVADADAQIDRMLSSPSSLSGETTASSIPDDAKDELDEFYESLFGNQTIAAEPITDEPATGEPPATALADTQADTPAVESLATDISIPAEQSQQSFAADTAIAPSDAQPLSTLQPIDTLPADTQAPAAVLAETAIVPPSVSTNADPTLGWDLLGETLTEQFSESEIPDALLDDELLDGWDLDDAEVDLETLDVPPAGDDPLGIGEAASTGDRPADERVFTLSSDAAMAPDEPQRPVAEPSSNAVLEPVTNSASGTGTAQPQDEIATLTDLFDEAPASEGRSLEPPIEAPAETPSQSLIVSPADNSPVVLPVATSGTPPSAETGDDRSKDDRYTPASPEEDLLPLHAVAEDPDPELWLDESTLNRLSEDLFNLEDAIEDPSVLPYEREPSAHEPASFSDATATDEPLPSSEPTSLEDWSASLGEGSSVLSTTPSQPPASDQGTIAEPDAFILEGMDDLFANTPTEPPVVPIAPPIAPPAEPSTAFTLEGISNLFADPLADNVPSPPPPPQASQPSPFTLEGMDDLFGDVPAVPSASLPSTPPLVEQPLPFTLEGVENLFTDLPPIADVPPAPELTTTTPPEELSTPTSAFSFEQVGNLFVEVPSAAPADTGIQETIAAPIEPLPESPAESIAPFTLEQVDGLFVETPSEASPILDVRSTESAPPLSEPFSEADATPFSLEQVGDLFADTPPEDPALDLTTSPILQPPSLNVEGFATEPPAPDLSSAEPATLEQAFASLMGSFDEPMPTATDEVADSQDPEKKKRMS
jgi:hypothetical protein